MNIFKKTLFLQDIHTLVTNIWTLPAFQSFDLFSLGKLFRESFIFCKVCLNQGGKKRRQGLANVLNYSPQALTLHLLAWGEANLREIAQTFNYGDDNERRSTNIIGFLFKKGLLGVNKKLKM